MGGIFAASVLAPTLLAVGILTLAAALALGAPAAFGGNDAPLSGPPALRDTLAAAAPDNVDITGDPTRVTGTRPPEDYRSGQPATGLAPAADTLFAELALVDAREIQPVLERVNQAGCGGRRGYLQYLCPSGDPPDASTLGQDVLVVHLAVNGPLTSAPTSGGMPAFALITQNAGAPQAPLSGSLTGGSDAYRTVFNSPSAPGQPLYQFWSFPWAVVPPSSDPPFNFQILDDRGAAAWVLDPAVLAARNVTGLRPKTFIEGSAIANPIVDLPPSNTGIYYPYDPNGIGRLRITVAPPSPTGLVTPDGGTGSNLAWWLLAGGGAAITGGGVMMRRRRDVVGTTDTAHDDVDFTQAFLEGFSLSGRGQETAAMNGAYTRAVEHEAIVQQRVAREYEILVQRAAAAYTRYTDALDRFQTAYVRALSGSTEMQGLLTQYREAIDVAEKQDIALAVVTLVRGLGTLAVRGVRWVRAPATAGGRTTAAGGRAVTTGTRGATALAPAAGAVPEWVVTMNRIRTNSKNLARIPGTHDVFVHGWVSGFIRQNAAGQWLTMSARRLRRVITRTSGWQPGMPIRLFSCFSARSGSAAALARELKTWVYAPTKRIWIDSRGQIMHDPGGLTVLFDPNGVARFVIRNGQRVPLP